MNELKDIVKKKISDAGTNPRAVAMEMKRLGATKSPPITVSEGYVRAMTYGRIKDAGKSKMDLFEEAIAGITLGKNPIKNAIDVDKKTDNGLWRIEPKTVIQVYASTGKDPINTKNPLEVAADLGAIAALEIEVSEVGDAVEVGDKAVFARYPRPVAGNLIVMVQTGADGSINRCVRRLVKSSTSKITVRKLSPKTEDRDFVLSDNLEIFKVVSVKKL